MFDLFPLIREDSLQYYHCQIEDCPFEVAAVDLPGEIWDLLIQASDLPLDIFEGPACLLAPVFVPGKGTPVISAAKFFREFQLAPPSPLWRILATVIGKVRELGYQHLLLIN